MDIVLYSTHCPKCGVLEKKLDMAGIEYQFVDDADVMIEKGFMSAPMLEVDGTPMDFMTAIKWVNERSAN